MQLSEFIVHDMEEILQDWENFAHSLDVGRNMSRRMLRNHAASILRAIAIDLERAQNSENELAKSQGRRDSAEDGIADSAAQTHANRRAEEGFTMPEMVSEYRALRASVIRRWRRRPDVPDDALAQVVRFNEAIDQALTESVRRFTDKVNRARELFMGVLGHDLRGPLHVIMRGTTYLQRSDISQEKREEMAVYVSESAEHMHRMVEDLVDVARTKLGGSLPIELKACDAAEICRSVLAEVRAQHEDRVFEFEADGDLRGTWDPGRVEQMLANLVRNAAEHGEPSRPVKLVARMNGQNVHFQVHNHGEPIPEHLLDRIFEPLVHTDETERNRSRTAHLGLGLYIACTIARAHGGTIGVESTKPSGTTFKVNLPKQPPSTARPSCSRDAC